MPSASFLLMIEAQMRYGLSTVPVTSRNAYNLRSAGAIFSVWPIMEHPQDLRTRWNSGTIRPTRNPGMDSSLSTGMQHGVRECGSLLARHSAQYNCHEPRGHLVIGNAAVGAASDQAFNFSGG